MEKQRCTGCGREFLPKELELPFYCYRCNNERTDAILDDYWRDRFEEEEEEVSDD